MRSSLKGKATKTRANANETVRKGKATQRKGNAKESKNNGDRSVSAHSVPVLLTIAKCAMGHPVGRGSPEAKAEVTAEATARTKATTTAKADPPRAAKDDN